MDSLTKFNPAIPRVMHIDINSAFATIEQQANPLLRGKPIVVAAYETFSGCILAPSIEAKKFGIKTSMRVGQAKKLCPSLIVLSADPPKYRFVHKKLKKIVGFYTNNYRAKSIDEFVLNFKDYPSGDLNSIALEIKQKIRREIGEWMSVSIGIATNRILAKLAADIKKPDGLTQINSKNYLEIYSKISLQDFCGIADRFEARLRRVGIKTVMDFYNAPLWKLKTAFASVNANYWYQRLRGWEVDDVDWDIKTFGHSYSVPRATSDPVIFNPILYKLIEKTAIRLRRYKFVAHGVHVGLRFKYGGSWHKGVSFNSALFDSRDIYKRALEILKDCREISPIALISVTCFNLKKENKDNYQMDFFEKIEQKRAVLNSIDSIKQKWGDFSIIPARIVLSGTQVIDRISFGNVRE